MFRWRRRWDSNPRYGLPYAGFQDRCLKPLGHSSNALTGLHIWNRGIPENRRLRTICCRNAVRVGFYSPFRRRVNVLGGIGLRSGLDMRMEIKQPAVLHPHLATRTSSATARELRRHRQEGWEARSASMALARGPGPITMIGMMMAAARVAEGTETKPYRGFSRSSAVPTRSALGRLVGASPSAGGSTTAGIAGPVEEMRFLPQTPAAASLEVARGWPGPVSGLLRDGK